jgi:hypothetical protein
MLNLVNSKRSANQDNNKVFFTLFNMRISSVKESQNLLLIPRQSKLVQSLLENI